MNERYMPRKKPKHVVYCDESMMAYQSMRVIFRPGQCVVFDNRYRLAHLPLVNAQHPAVISKVDDSDYRNGTYKKTRYAFIMPIDDKVFLGADLIREIDQSMKSASFSKKIAWELCETRRTKLHATIVSGLSESDLERCSNEIQNLLDQIGPVSICLKGPLVGVMNTGRIYFPVYPQIMGGEDVFACMQKVIGAPLTRLYLVGYYHMRDELDTSETSELASLLGQWQDKIVLEMNIPYFELHATNDDLALSAYTYKKISVKKNKE